MIGQDELLRTLADQAENFPRFSVFVGPEGCGKKTLCEYVGKLLGAPVYFSDTKVDAVRSVIDNAYSCTGRPCVYVFADADTMSPAAKNALLKITEEPPKNAYFLMTLQDLNNTLATIKSRARVFYMDPYTCMDLQEYYTKKAAPAINEEDLRIIMNVCETPGDVNKLLACGAQDFHGFVEKVVDNIAVVSGSNSFKITQKLKLKETDEDKYDLKLFFRIFMSVCMSRLHEDLLRYASGVEITTKFLQELMITGINKTFLVDQWILDVRKAWM